MNRRTFNGLIAASLIPNWLQSAGIPTYPFSTLNDAFKSLGFNPSRKGNSYFVVTSDVHYGMAGSGGMAWSVAEVNNLNPRPAFFCVNGDLILTASRSFGVIPDEKGRQIAIEEFRQFKKDADQLNPAIPLKLTLGNHDTHPGEIDPALFWEVYPNYPPYQSLEQNGIHVLFLNGHSTGYIDDKQLEWLKADVSRLNPKQIVIVFVHQPSMSHTVRERGIPEAIASVFEKHRGPIWLIGGHEHHNDHHVFKLPHTTLIEHHITCGASNIWGDQERPGYWIYCLEKDRVVGRIFRKKAEGYRLEPFPDLSAPEAIPVPFDGVTGLVWKCMTDQNERQYLEVAKASYCNQWWGYVKEMVYRIPLGQINGPKQFVGLLTEHKSENHRKAGQYFLSADKVTWQEVQPARSTRDVLWFALQESLKTSENVYFRFVPAGEASVAGIAIIS